MQMYYQLAHLQTLHDQLHEYLIAGDFFPIKKGILVFTLM